MLLGPPGAGKGEQCSRLVSLGWQTVSTGQLLRQASVVDDERGREIKTMLNQGALVPDACVLALLEDHLKSRGDSKLILDGFPRTLSQVHAMSSLQLMPERIFVLVVPDDILLERLCGRWIEPLSGRVYHDIYHPPAVAGRDDISGAPLVKREDDDPDTIRARLVVYHKTVGEMLKHFSYYQQTHGILINYLDATDTIDAVYKTITHML